MVFWFGSRLSILHLPNGVRSFLELPSIHRLLVGDLGLHLLLWILFTTNLHFAGEQLENSEWRPIQSSR